MTIENTGLSEESLYHRLLYSARDMANNPNHSSEFLAVADLIVEEVMTAIRQKVENKLKQKANHVNSV